LIEDVAESTASVVRSLHGLTEEQVRGPSLLPEWTRGHVATHIARNADALVNLLTWARTGEETPMYPSREARAAAIEQGASRSPAELLADVEASHLRFLEAANALSEPDWAAVVRWGAGGSGRSTPATTVPWMRRVEVEVHHVDLNLDYTLAHWPEDFVELLLAETVEDFSDHEGIEPFTLVGNEEQGRWLVAGGGREITGPPPALLGWLLGRSEGIALHSDAPLPEIGAWR
jgi:maleylpyruvate isomerase